MNTLRNWGVCLLMGLSFSVAANAQQLYMPRNFKRAVAHGTRSLSGAPGPRYWQNHARYDIRLQVAPPDRTIRGVEDIQYINESPDSLHDLVIRLTLNVHKPGAIHYQDYPQGFLTDGVQIDSFVVRDRSRDFSRMRGHDTWKMVPLAHPLLPGDSIHLHVAWHYEISRIGDREGMIDSTTYYLAYFYPELAVYDDYNGWNRLDFTGYQEFYHDFNDYRLSVKVPRNFLVWATGTLQDPDAVLESTYAERLEHSMQVDSTCHIVTPQDRAQGGVTRQGPWNTWVWTAHQVPDVALGISDHYDWDASSVLVDPQSGRRVSMQAAYNDTSRDYHQAVQVGRDCLGWYSRNWPGVPYPFPKMTAFQGYADMEYPMMVNDASNADTTFSRLVENHEIAHSYFPFYMGINESRYAFMDEGWATTLELLIGRDQTSRAQADAFYRRFRITGYIHDPSQEEDLPIVTPANVLRGVAYGNNAYGKPSLAYLALKDLLGDRLFRTSLHRYMDLWHGKHPTPWDFFNAMSTASGRHLNWFWSNWFFSNNYVDLGIASVKPDGKQLEVRVTNVGGFDIPFDVRISYRDGSTRTLHETPAVWQDGRGYCILKVPASRPVSRIVLDNGIDMDANLTDNSWNAAKP